LQESAGFLIKVIKNIKKHGLKKVQESAGFLIKVIKNIKKHGLKKVQESAGICITYFNIYNILLVYNFNFFYVKKII
jgi:hypothetical protein